MIAPASGPWRVALFALPLLLAQLTPVVHAHGCHHRGDHGHDGQLVRAWLASSYPEMTEAQVERLLASPQAGALFPAQTSVVQGSPCPLETVEPPPGWFAGDTHVHVQGCPPFAPGAVTPADLVADMIDLDLAVTTGLVFGADIADPDQFAAELLPLVTGAPDPASTAQHLLQFGMEVSTFSGDRHGHPMALNIGPDQADVFQLGLGCEPLFDPRDHPVKVDWIDYYLALQAGQDPTQGVFLGDGSGGQPAALLRHFRQAPRAVTGWAHTMWPVPLYAEVCDGGWDWQAPGLPDYVGEDLLCGAAVGRALAVPPVFAEVDFLYPAFAPFDVALGLADFLEALNLDSTLAASTTPAYCPGPVDGPVPARWDGLYDKLLGVGLRVAPAGGSDSPCTTGLVCPPRTWVRTDDVLPEYTSWTSGLARGRVSLASGGHQFLDLQVSRQGAVYRPGDQVELEPGQAVRAQAVLSVVSDGDPQHTGVLELLVDGEVVASQPFGPLPAGESQVAFPEPVLVPAESSGWIAARSVPDPVEEGGLGHALGHTRTGAVYTVVAGQPASDCELAEAFLLYADYLRWRLDELEAAAAGGDAWDQVLLMALVGCEQDRAAQRAHLAEGRAVFAALRDHAHGPPPGVQRYGRSTHATGQPPMALNVRRVRGEDEELFLRFTAFNAPRNQPLPGEPSQVTAWLVLGPEPLSRPDLVSGAGLWIDPDQPLMILPVEVNSGGYVELTIDQPQGGGLLHAQLLVEAPTFPSASGPLTASDALAIQLGP